MTALVTRLPRAVPSPRLRGLARTELRLYARFGVLAAAGGITALWVAVLVLLPADVARAVTPFVLLTDITALGFLFVPALLVVERTDGVDRATRVTPTRAGELIGVRVAAAVVLSLACAGAVVAAGGVDAPGVSLLGVATLSALIALVAVVLVGGADTLGGFLVRSPFVAGPLLAPAFVAAVGLGDHPLLHVSPVTSAFELLAGELSWFGVAWQLAWIVGAGVVAHRALARPPAPPTTARAVHRRAATPRTHPGVYRRVEAVRALARADRRGLLRDGLLVMLLVGVPIVAFAARLLGTVGVPWIRQRYGVDVAAYLPAVWAFVLVVHTPVMFGSLTGLLLLEDRDHGLLPAIATTRASLGTLVGYRLTATAAVTAAMVAVGLPLAGAAHPAGAPGAAATVVAAASVSTVPALLMAAFARNRVQGIAAMKLMSLPLYLPVASWFVDPPVRWLFAPVPTAWATWTTWASSTTAAAAFAIGAVGVSALVTAALARRFLGSPVDR